MNHRLIIVLWGVSLLLFAAIPFAYFRWSQSPSSVDGILIDLPGRVTLADEISLRDGSGKIWAFRLDPEVFNNSEHAQSFSHLREHIEAQNPVTVRYRRVGSVAKALRILDRPRDSA